MENSKNLHADKQTNHMNEFEPVENLDMLESDAFETRLKGTSAADELPETLYRLKALHSCETFYGFFEPPMAAWPEFRTLHQLERHLKEGLSAQEPSSGDVAETVAEKKVIPPCSIAIAPTKYGRDIVEVQGCILDTTYVTVDDLVPIERPATVEDIRHMEENLQKEKSAYELCRDKIWARNLPMKLVAAHYLLDEPKILFYFTADSRVDFRELVKDLVAAFKMRIELRQIGVRDEARVTGGCGVCGRVLCCHGVSDKLNPVSIKMAKDQNLSLNSLKISGPCGRLLCCLSYEYQFYKDARRELPQEGVKFIYENVQFRVIEVNVLASTVKMAGEDGRLLDMKAECFKYCDGRWKIIEEQANS